MQGQAAAAFSENLIDDVLAGRRRSISRAMSLAETTGSAGRELAAAIYGHTGRAHVVGLTGVPGSGKSTMVRVLAQNFRRTGRRVGIVAVDPSSPFSGGAILGDRIRMLELAGDPGVFIRSMATRGALGGLARASLDVVDVFDAAGFDIVLIETVGVGQDEVDIVQAAHTVVVVSAPGLGDEIQAIKAGVLEIADIHVVSKCDRPEASETVVDLKTMLKLGESGRHGVGEAAGWSVPVLATSAQNREGMEELVAAIDGHRTYLDRSGEIADRRRRIAEMRILKTAEEIVRARILGRSAGMMEALVGRVAAGRVDPYSAALGLVDQNTKPTD
ncbi:MAG: methylmalonyl Co-A mutase-associated GTPase MeaB [Rhodospirillales bacterium]|nr:methylmalonyl Co-A mutase-associated GTPase MeaB [Rhodospirillales bacterium]